MHLLRHALTLCLGLTLCASATAADLKILDGFVLGKTPLIPYLEEKSQWCNVKELETFYDLNGVSCYNVPGLLRVGFHANGRFVITSYMKRALPDIMKKLKESYGEPQHPEETRYVWHPSKGQEIALDTEERLEGAFSISYVVEE